MYLFQLAAVPPSISMDRDDLDEDVVYAELDLQSYHRPGPSVVRGNMDDKTEYAEIIAVKPNKFVLGLSDVGSSTSIESSSSFSTLTTLLSFFERPIYLEYYACCIL
uniref:Uncharacterized protein n=1 Tax=Clastoptera arizonana TaxID=38151 RepID=A0A1B6DY84_9HEMI